MEAYTCPTCGAKMERDLLLFTRHTDQHIVDEIKKQHPNWVTQDGFCLRCLEYFKKSIGKSGAVDVNEPSGALANIGPREIDKRTIFGITTIALGLMALAILYYTHSERAWRVFLFPLFFGGTLGILQARQKLCVVLADKGVRNMDGGEQQVTNPTEADRFRKRASKILLSSLISAFAATLFCYLIP